LRGVEDKDAQMIGEIVSYAASRVAGETVEGLARRAVWGALAAVLALATFVFLVLIVFWTFEPEYGAMTVATALAVACAIGALVAVSVPILVEKYKESKRVKQSADPVSQTVAAVVEETEAAVDYFGAVQVVASAFVFGIGAARQLRQR
jgi:hypothetical protein